MFFLVLLHVKTDYKKFSKFLIFFLINLFLCEIEKENFYISHMKLFFFFKYLHFFNLFFLFIFLHVLPVLKL